MINVNLLPKHLRRVREPGYWKVIMVAFPLVVGAVIAGIQIVYNQTQANLERETDRLEAEKLLYEDDIALQQELEAELANLRELLAIRDQVMADKVDWFAWTTNLLETLPAQGDSARPRISFQSLNMQAVNPPEVNEGRYEGESILAEMDLSGTVANTEVLSEFIGTLENSDIFGVAFQSASRDEETGIYSYSMTVGALSGGVEQ